ncbi:hypothetical protein JTB14_005173 [Gonioctena quinquepunctata]|nr:hypothetical protein JTB14_005173 [Gonioctena quinquepunctata]
MKTTVAVPEVIQVVSTTTLAKGSGWPLPVEWLALCQQRLAEWREVTRQPTLQSVVNHHSWTEAPIMRTVEMKLRDKAREYYGALPPN